MEEKEIQNKGFEEICNNIEDNVFVHSVDLICLYANKKLIEALGQDIIGMDLYKIFPHKSKEYIEEIKKQYEKIRETKKGYKEPEQTQILPNGEERVYSVTKTPILGEGTPAVAGIGKDITAITDAKKEVEETSAALNKFMRHAIHDIKNPAGAIIGFTRIIDEKIKEIEDDIEDTEKMKENITAIKTFLGIILLSGNRISNFAEGLNDFQKIKEKKPEISIINTKDFFKQIGEQQLGFLYSLNQRANRKNEPQKDIKIIFDDSLSILPPIFQSDEHMLERLFSNLISNSIKFTKQGSITISCSKKNENQKDNYYIFTVHDTGMGIAPENHNIIFKEFESVHHNDTSITTGAGLGLTSVTEIVKAFGGKILPIQSELGKGTAISFEIPIKIISY